MPLDHRWVQFAEDDLQMAALALEAEIWNQTCFHAQQAVEKYLKSAFDSRSIPKTHKFADLVNAVPFELPKDLAARLILLDRFYIPTRYPDAIPGSLETGLPNRQDAEEAMETSREVKEWLTVNREEQTRP